VTSPITTSSSASERSTTSTLSHVRGVRHTTPTFFSFLALDAAHRTITATSPFDHHQFSLSSHVSRLTRHCQGTPSQDSPCSDPFFFAFSWVCCAALPSQMPRIPSCHQYNGMCYLHTFAGKTHQVRSRPAGGWAILTCIPSGVAFTLPETKTYWTRSHRQPAISSASCDCHRRRLFIQPDGTPTSPKRALAQLMTEHLRLEGAAASLSRSLLPALIPIFQTLSSRDLQRWWDARDRLSGKLGPKTSYLIEMYREKERQTAIRSSPGKSSASTSTSQEQQSQRSGLVAKESTPLPPPPATSEPSLSPPDTPRMGVEGEPGPAGADGDELMEPPNIDFDDGRDSPYRYIHGATLHNVAEEEEEE
jgi:hypothetical protein